MFDDFQMCPPGTRRPPCDSLLDVFTNICDDEGQHVETMRACQDYSAVGERVVSPHVNEGVEGLFSTEQAQLNIRNKRESWKKWAAEVSKMK